MDRDASRVGPAVHQSSLLSLTTLAGFRQHAQPGAAAQGRSVPGRAGRRRANAFLSVALHMAGSLRCLPLAGA